MMRDVNCSRLGDLLLLKRRPVNTVPEAEYTEIGIYSFGKGIFHKQPRSGLEVGNKELFLIKKGDFILQITFAWEGAVGLATESEDGMYGSVRFPTFRVDESRCFSPYLVNYFRTQAGRDQLVKISPGSAGRNRVLNLKRLSEVLIPLPPLEEQHRIVARIEELASRIEEARGLRRETVEEVEALNRSAARVIFDKDNSLSFLPLRELVAVRGGGTPSKSNPFFWEGAIPWISPKDMKFREITDSIDHISERAVQESSAKLIEPGAVLIVTRGMILAHTVPSAILRVSAAINQDMKALVPGKQLLPEYLTGTLWALNDELLQLVEKSTHDTRKLETPKLLDFKIPVPPLPEQRRIVAYLDGLQAKVDALRKLQGETRAEMDALLPSVLDRAFKGELV